MYIFLIRKDHVNKIKTTISWKSLITRRHLHSQLKIYVETLVHYSVNIKFLKWSKLLYRHHSLRYYKVFIYCVLNNNVCGTYLKVQTVDGKLLDKIYFVEQKSCWFTKMLSGTYCGRYVKIICVWLQMLGRVIQWMLCQHYLVIRFYKN